MKLIVFCQKCGNEIKDGAKFCDKCGTAVNYEQNITVDSANVGTPKPMDFNKTNYAGTSFWCSIAGIPLFCCGIGLAMGIPATIFGALAIKNKEADKVKAYIGLVIGIIELIFLCGFIYAMIRDA